jgi:hypothetical protein
MRKPCIKELVGIGKKETEKIIENIFEDALPKYIVAVHVRWVSMSKNKALPAVASRALYAFS